MNIGNYQVIRELGFRYRKFKPNTGYYAIYEWIIGLGVVQIRKFVDDKNVQKRLKEIKYA